MEIFPRSRNAGANASTGAAHADDSPLSAEVAEVEVDIVEAVEEGTDPKRQRRHVSTQNQQLLADDSNRTVSGGWRW